MKKTNVLESTYNNLPHQIKNRVGFPINYFNLTDDQRDFLETFFTNSVIDLKDKDYVKKQLKHIRDNLNSIDFEVDAIEDELFGELGE